MSVRERVGPADRAVLRRDDRPLVAPFSRTAVLVPAGLLLVVLLAFSDRYGYHRDELYFRLLPPAWGYTDQPPFTPLVAHLMTAVADEPWALRVPAAIVAAVAVVVAALICREVGGGRGAQALAAWGAGFGYYPLLLGHVLYTATFDLVVWPLVVLCVLRAVRRHRGRWFLVAGLVVGLSLYNKLLVLALLLAIAVGLAVAGPRRASLWGWAAAGVAIAAVAGAPNLVFQAVQGFPELHVGSALQGQNSTDVRPFVVPFLVALLGPATVPMWVTGVVAPFRRAGWGDVRWLSVAFVAIVAIVVVMGVQLYYDLGVLTAVYAVGCVPVAEWAADRGRRPLLAAGLALNTVAGGVLALPMVPQRLLAGTVIPAWSQSTRDQLGWPALAAQVDGVAAAHGRDAVVLTANYGEAAAVARFAPDLARRVYSGHNAMHDLPPPPATTRVVVAVGYGMGWVDGYFRSCRTVGALEDGDGVASQEQGAPVRVCSDPTRSVASLWSRAARVG